LIALGFFGDAADSDSDDGVRASYRLDALPLPLPVGALIASPGISSPSLPEGAIPSMLILELEKSHGWV